MKDKPISIIGNTVNTEEQKECVDRLQECRDWIDEQLNIVCAKYNLPNEVKHFVFDMVANVVLYTQETTSAVYRYSTSNNNK